MKQIQIRFLGTEIFSMILFSGDADVVEERGDSVDPEGITGGSAQNFERDFNPLSPEDRYGDEEFGFHA